MERVNILDMCLRDDGVEARCWCTHTNLCIYLVRAHQQKQPLPIIKKKKQKRKRNYKAQNYNNKQNLFMHICVSWPRSIVAFKDHARWRGAINSRARTRLFILYFGAYYFARVYASSWSIFKINIYRLYAIMMKNARGYLSCGAVKKDAAHQHIWCIYIETAAYILLLWLFFQNVPHYVI